MFNQLIDDLEKKSQSLPYNTHDVHESKKKESQLNHFKTNWNISYQYYFNECRSEGYCVLYEQNPTIHEIIEMINQDPVFQVASHSTVSPYSSNYQLYKIRIVLRENIQHTELYRRLESKYQQELLKLRGTIEEILKYAADHKHILYNDVKHYEKHEYIPKTDVVQTAYLLGFKKEIQKRLNDELAKEGVFECQIINDMIQFTFTKQTKKKLYGCFWCVH